MGIACRQVVWLMQYEYERRLFVTSMRGEKKEKKTKKRVRGRPHACERFGHKRDAGKGIRGEQTRKQETWKGADE